MQAEPPPGHAVESKERFRSQFSALCVVLLAATYGAILLGYRSRSVGGSDSSGYLNLAKGLAKGEVVQPIEPLHRLGFSSDDRYLFIPLGYVAGPRPGTMATFYPPGFSLHIAAAAALLGWSEGPFLISPLFAATSLILLFLVARALGIGRVGSFACSAAFAASPILAFQGVQPMSDTAAVAWALAAILCALKSRRRLIWSSLAGLAFGVGVLVRPASAILLVPLLFAMPLRLRAWLLFGVGALPCASFYLAFNTISYGAPGKTGYGVGGSLADFAVANFPVRFRHYIRGISAMMTPLLPSAWLLSAADFRRPLRTRALLLSWFAVFFLFYCFYGPYEAWWFTRYLLPGLPALLIASAMVGEDLLLRVHEAHSDPHRVQLVSRVGAAAALLVTIVVCGAGFRFGRKSHVLFTREEQAIYPESIRWASSRVPECSVVLAMEFSGAMRAYGWGTFLRWDYVEPARFPDIRRRLQEGGYGIYALMLPHEVTGAAPRVPGAWTYLGSNRDASLWRLDSPPL